MNVMNKVVLGAALLVGAGWMQSAQAADITEPYVEPAPAPLATGGWYLRGAIGMSNQRVGKLDYQYFNSDPNVTTSWLDKGGFDSAPTFTLGAGYKFNDWFRADVTGQYRGASNYHSLQAYTVNSPASSGTDDYTARKSEWLFLANGYVDLGNYRGIVPYIGAGIGASRNTISGFNDVNVEQGGGGYAGSESKWNFAWGLHAGLGFKVTENLIFDIGYSYLDLGDASTGTAYNYDPNLSRPNKGFKFDHITSHDVNLGIRYTY